MVARSYIKSILRSVKSSASRFIAIFAIVALGVGFLAGLLSATPDMRHSVAVYYDDTHFMDLEIMSNLGMCDADLEALAALPGVDGVSPAMTVDLLATTQTGDGLVVRTHAMDITDPEGQSADHINRSVLVDGRWPQGPHECVMEFESDILGGLNVGDTITFTRDNKDLADILGPTEFTVVGMVSTSYYLNMTQRGYTTVGNGRIGAIVHLPWESFVTDYYTAVHLTMADGAETFSEAYLAQADAMADTVERLSETQKLVRRDAIRDDAEALLEDARQQLAEAEQEVEDELADARQKLEDGESELADARQKLADGWRDYNEGVQELADGRATYETEIADAESELEEGRLELADALTELEDGWVQLLDGESELEANRPALEDGRAQLLDAAAQLADGWQEFADGQRELDENRATLDDSWAKLEAAALDIEAGAAELESGRDALDAASAQLAAGWEEYEQGLLMLEAFNAGIAVAEANMETLEALMAQAQGHEPEELLAWAQDYITTNAEAAEDIRQRMQTAPEDVTPDEQAMLTLYDNLVDMVANSDELMAYLHQLQDEYQDAEAVMTALRDQRDGMAEQLADAAAQLEDGERQLEEGRAAFREGQRAYAAGVREYEQGLLDLEEGEALWQEGAETLEEGRRELLDAEAELAEGQAEFDEKLAEFEDAERKLQDARAELEDGQAAYEEGLLELEDGQRELEEAKETALAEFEDAELKLQDALAELRSGESEILDGEAELEDGWAEYHSGAEEAEDKLLEARDELTAAEDKLRDLEEPTWYILTRESNPGFVSYKSDSEKIEAIARVFPIFFFLVATLVASTTMTRMVEEERGNIGTLKALGYTGGHIAAKFFSYATAAALLGSAVGLMIGLRLFPSIIYNAYGMMYNLPPMQADKHIFYGALSTGAIFVGIMLATAGALSSSLRENAASLMRPKSPPEGKRIFLERITPLWRRMKFTYKVTARNLIRYKKRFFMTVVGIFGCTALLLCGFGLRDSISDIVAIQFGEIFTYNLQVTLKHNGDHLTDRRISSVMEDPQRVSQYVAVHQETVRIRAGTPEDAGQRQVEVTLTATDSPDELPQMISLRQRESGVAVGPVAGDAVYLSEKAAMTLDLGPGDSLCVEDEDGGLHGLVVAGIVENYVQGYLYMSDTLYESTFGKPCAYTTLLANAADETAEVRDALSSALLVSPNIIGVSFSTTLKETFDEMLTTIDFIVVVLIVSAGLLAFVVMYNLTNINITERIKELATIKVLGFTQRETAGYIFRETTILAVVGALVGLVGGVFLQRFIVTTVEVDNMMFGRVIKPISYVLSLVITLAFSMIVNLFMSRKLRAINMAEALKAPE